MLRKEENEKGIRKHFKEVRKYFKRKYPTRSCPEIVSMSYVGDFEFCVCERTKSKVSVHRVVLSDGQIAFGTVGGIIPESSYSSVFPKKDTPNAETAARFHLYQEGVLRHKHIFETEEGGLERLADLLRIPEKLRIKE